MNIFKGIISALFILFGILGVISTCTRTHEADPKEYIIWAVFIIIGLIVFNKIKKEEK
jgi:multisubunit Na+/H+ antiporter MnhG subunit